MSEELLEKINAAVKAANEAEQSANAAEQSATTAKAELVSRSKAVGLLLLEAKKLHPVVTDFEAFLKKVRGLGLSRAYECMSIAGGRTTVEEIRKATRDRVKKHRDKKKLPRTPEPIPISVTSTRVTESAEASAERRKAENANPSSSPEERAVKLSADNLSEFQVACRTYLPNLIEADLKKARVFFMEGAWKPRTKRQEAA
jgi:hypothetical protein